MAEPAAHNDTLVPRSRYVLAIAAITFALGFLEFTRLLVLPYGAWLSEVSTSVVSSATVVSLMTMAGYTGLFVWMTLESASLPIPSELVLPLAGYLVSIHAMNLWLAILVATAAGVVGALLDYGLALWLGRPFVAKLLRLSGMRPNSLDGAEVWFDRSGEWAVFAARFVPGLRSIISLPAGLFRMGVRSFVLLTAAGALAWSTVLIYAGDLAGNLVMSGGAFESSPTLDQVLSGLTVALSAAYIGYYLLKGRSATSIRGALGS